MTHRLNTLGQSLLLSLGLLAFAGGQAAFAQTTYTAGHADIGVEYGGPGDLSIFYRFGVDAQPASLANPLVTVDPADIVVQVIDVSVPRPAGTEWDFLGNSAGDPLWFLPQGQDPAKPFLGFSTESLVGGDWAGGVMTYTLLNVVSSPAGSDFSLWQTGGFGEPLVRWSTDDSILAFDLGIGTHAHYNWGFTKQGTYQLAFQVSGTHDIDGFQSVSDVFTFQVVPEPSTWVLATAGLLAAGFAGRRRMVKKSHSDRENGDD